MAVFFLNFFFLWLQSCVGMEKQEYLLSDPLQEKFAEPVLDEKVQRSTADKS